MASTIMTSTGMPSSTKMAMASASVIPQGVGAPPPPGLDSKKGKLMCIRVRMLDDTVGVFHLGHKAHGQALFDEVCRHLNLLECDYFGLEYLDWYGNSCWLDKEKPLLKQITAARSDARFNFIVKFYTPNPADLEEEYTRYLFALQIKRDLASGHFVCNENTASLMASYIVQSECGDFSSDDYYDHSYLSFARFIPNQCAEFEKKVMESHKKLIGMSPAESDMALLETARRSEFYGVKFHTCRDVEGAQTSITVLHMGMKVYHQLSCSSTFSWAKIRKLSFRMKRLFIKLHPENYAYYKDTVEFIFETRNECKMFWKKCIEHHTFFRCTEITRVPRHRSKLFTKGSSFRYSGRTQKQLDDYVREHQKRREPFTRPIHSSMTRKIINERLLPTPIHSQPGSLIRQNGRSSIRDERSRYGVSMTEELGDQQSPAIEPRTKVEQTPENGGISPKSEIKEIGSANAYAISSPFRKGTRSRIDCNDQTTDERISTSKDRTIHSKVEPPGHDDTSENATSNAWNVRNYENIETVSYDRVELESNERNIAIRLLLTDSVDGSFSGSHTVTDEKRNNKRNASIDKAFCITKELLMTERTYVRDLSIIAKNLKSALIPYTDNKRYECTDHEDESKLNDIFSVFESLLMHHENLLREIHRRYNAWENKLNQTPTTPTPESNVEKIGDLLLCAMHNSKQIYDDYGSRVFEYCSLLTRLSREDDRFAEIHRDFEAQKLCYVDLNVLLMKPIRRLVAYQDGLKRLITHYIEEGGLNADLSDCKVAQEKLSTLIGGAQARTNMKYLENYVKLCQIERDLSDVRNLVTPTRTFIREGSLRRYTRKEPVERLFVLFHDCLLYAARNAGAGSARRFTFKLHGQIPLRALMLENGDALRLTNETTERYSFTIYDGTRSFVVAASCADEKRAWLEDIHRAVMRAKESKLDLPSLKCVSTEDIATNVSTCPSSTICGGTSTFKPSGSSCEPETHALDSPVTSSRQLYYRMNDTLHVCWHRTTTLSAEQWHESAFRCQLSAYLYRKLRTSTGWQKLWVVFADFCLFFHKTHQDSVPLASLPILGYTITTPTAEDEIRKEYVFKLRYKAQVYFFRADSQFALNRWLEVLRVVCRDQCDPPS